MLNFKKVLIGEVSNLELTEESNWPQLGATKSNIPWKLLGNSDQGIMNSEAKIKNDNDMSNPQVSTSKNLSSPKDFPELMYSFQSTSASQCRTLSFNENSMDSSHYGAKEVETNRTSKCMKPKKIPSKMPITVDLHAMLKMSLSLAERKRLKRLTHNRNHLLDKNVAYGNKLDSDSPARHKGKKRPHRRKKTTPIKRSFLLAEEKSKRTLPASTYFCKKMIRLRQLILSGLGKGQTVDDLVMNLRRMNIDGIEKETPIVQQSTSKLDIAKSMLHTRNFRSYCDHLLIASLKEKSAEFVGTLRGYQDKMYMRDPINSKSKRRYVCGCHEARKFLRADSVKLLFIACNLNVECEMPEILSDLMLASKERKLPIIFGGTSKDLGYWTLKKRKICVIAILNYEGAEKQYNELIIELTSAKNYYQLLLEKMQLHLQSGNEDVALNCLAKFADLQENKQHINENVISKLAT